MMIAPNICKQFFENPSFCRGSDARALANQVKEVTKLVSSGAVKFSNASKDDEYNPLVEYLEILYPNQRKPLRIDEVGIAHIHLFGPVGLDLDAVERAFGLTDYLQIREDFETAKRAGAKGILLYGWSPGGSVSGSLETAEVISRTAREIPVFSFSEKGFFSAGYMLTCASTKCWGTKTGMYGNIGTIIDFWDLFEYWSQIGVFADQITNEGADLKDTFYKPKLSEAHREFLQQSVNSDGKMFQDWVLKHRTISNEKEVFRAGWYAGTDAMNLGLIDYVGGIQDAYDTLLGRTS